MRERWERDARGVVGLSPPASAAAGLAAKVLADAHTRPGQDEALELLRRMLAQRLDCPAPALGLFGVGLLYLLTRKSEESIYIGPAEAADIEGLANRLARRTATPHASARTCIPAERRVGRAGDR